MNENKIDLVRKASDQDKEKLQKMKLLEEKFEQLVKKKKATKTITPVSQGVKTSYRKCE